MTSAIPNVLTLAPCAHPCWLLDEHEPTGGAELESGHEPGARGRRVVCHEVNAAIGSESSVTCRSQLQLVARLTLQSGNCGKTPLAACSRSVRRRLLSVVGLPGEVGRIEAEGCELVVEHVIRPRRQHLRRFA